jgi:NADH dehydrogenase
MRIFVTGGTGFVGREVLHHLVAAGHQVRALVREGSEHQLTTTEKIEVHHGDATEASSLNGALSGCEAIIHLVGIIREFPARGITFEQLHVKATQNLLAAAEQQSVKRYLHMSANGTRPNSFAAYHRSKWQAEQAVRATDLDWTIFRPSLIFGTSSEFVTMLADLIRKLPVVPVIGDGQYRMQPVAVEQVAETFAKALSMPQTAGQTYHLGGAEAYSYDEILDLTGRALGKEKLVKAHNPLFMVKPMIRMLEGLSRFPITNDQLTMMLEGNCCDPAEWAGAFAIEPISYAEGIPLCLANLAKSG